MARWKKQVLDFNNHEMFPLQDTVCDFSEIESLNEKNIFIKYTSVNVNLYDMKMKMVARFANWDFWRINSPYFNDMDKYKIEVRKRLSERKINYQELLF